jgi:macrolide transport system ATP-binding/permease protein
MRKLRAWLLRLGGLWRKNVRERELSAELESHLALHIEDNLRAGMSPELARREAIMKLGGREQVSEMVRERRGFPSIDILWQDVRFGVRIIRKNPGFTSIAVLTLALGIGVNTAVFTALDALVLRPRPVKEPKQLVALFRTTHGDNRGRFSYPDYVYYRDHSKSFTDFSLFAFGMGLTSSDLPTGGPEAIPRIVGAAGFEMPQLLQGSAQAMVCYFVSGNYFQLLGAVPLRGRLLSPDDDRPNAPPVVVLSGNFWQRQFHSDPKVVGSALHLNGTSFTVVGVTPVDYTGTLPNVPPLWATVAAKVFLGGFKPHDLENRLTIAGSPEGRLKPGVTLGDAQAELNVLAAQLQNSYPQENHDAGVAIVSEANKLALLEPGEWALITAAMTAVVLLLLIACANVASLLLARAAARSKEIALRLAIGAGRTRLLRQLVTESLLIALLAGAIALPVAGWLLRLLIMEISSALPSAWGSIALQVSPDIPIFLFTLLISGVAGVAFGLTPALQATKADVNAALKEESVFGQRVRRGPLRGILIGGQVAACVVLLVCSALLLRGSERALKIDLGYASEHVLGLEMFNAIDLHYSQERLLHLSRELRQGIANAPGVLMLAQASRAPIGGVRIVAVSPTERRQASANEEGSGTLGAGYSFVTPNYFETLNIPVVRGRVFTAVEAEGQVPVVVISEATAQRLWPGEDALGKQLTIGTARKTMSFPGEVDPFLASAEVIGIAGDVHSIDLRKIDESYVYLPLAPNHQWTSTLLLRTAGAPKVLLPTLGHIFHDIDPNVPVLAAPLRVMVSMDPFFVVSRVGGLLASIVGVMGLLLACMGVYGMVSYSVTQRTREIGVRMALGAGGGQVLRLVLLDGFAPILWGMLAGLVVSAGASRLLAATLFGLSPWDAVSYCGVSLLLAGVALVAIVLPAQRATRVDPMVALRYE